VPQAQAAARCAREGVVFLTGGKSVASKYQSVTAKQHLAEIIQFADISARIGDDSGLESEPLGGRTA
jgi:hypothetical protein